MVLRDLLNAILRVVFGHNLVENAKDWHKANKKASKSRAEIDTIIAKANQDKKGK